MAKDKELIQAEKASEASDKELENVSGGTEITDNESIIINNNIFDTSINKIKDIIDTMSPIFINGG